MAVEELLLELNVLLFASYAEAFGNSAIRVRLPAGASVADLLAEVRAMGPAVGLPPAAVAVNAEYAQGSHVLGEDDEVALIPPVAGG